MHGNRFVSAAALSAAILSPIAAAAGQQSDLTISPFVSFLPSVGTSPLAGLALTLAGNGGFGLRASGHLALENSNTSAFSAPGSMRPWGVDGDALLGLGAHVGLAPFVFAGIGMSSNDSIGYRTTHYNWSYGAGATLPLGSAVDIFGEARWRMSSFVLPTATTAPSPTNELRVGMSFHVGGGASNGGRRSRDRRMDLTPSSRLPIARSPVSIPSTSSSNGAARVLITADKYIGVPYRFGGTSPSGFDCSGFVQYVFERNGVRLPRTAGAQAQVGEALPADWRKLSAGDLVMFDESGRIDHVAIYAGRNRIIHSSSSGGGVRYDDLSTQRGEWFADHLVAARRVTPNGRGLLDLAQSFSNTFGTELDPPDHAPRPR